MKKIKILIIALIAFSINSCVLDTVDSLSEFTLQIPVMFVTDYLDRASPDTSIDFTHLMKYDAYKENKDKIAEAIVYQLNYRIDSLVLENGVPFGPGTPDIVFDRISFKLQFGKSRFGNTYSLNPNDYIPDPDSPIYELGEFVDVSVREYYRRSDHILEVPGSTASVISKTLKSVPYFYIITEYSRIKGQTTEKVIFPFISSKFDVIIRVKVEL